MPSVACPNCRRQISDQSRRCLYCGRLLTASSEAEVQEDLRRTQRMAAIYEAGIGFGGGKGRRHWTDELSEKHIVVKLLFATLMFPLAIFSPFKVLRSIKAIFES